MELKGTDSRWSVGRLARASGLTVRTLHHWDELGLLRPSERTHAGHRRYAPEDVRRLYRILALRRLGLPLAEVARTLDDEGPGLRQAVAGHLDRVERELASAAELRDRLRRLLQVLDADGVPSGDELIDTIEVMTMYEQHYTPEQLRRLAQRAEQVGPEGMERVQREWAELLDEVRTHKDAGVDPADPRMQECARRWNALIEQFTGGDPGIRASLQRFYDEEGAERASHGMIDPEVMAYAAEAQAALERS